MDQEISFPIMNITDYIFEAERVYFSDVTWQSERILKGKSLKKVPEWRIIDSKGRIFRVEIIEKTKKNSFLSFIFGYTYRVHLNLVFTNNFYELKALIDKLLTNKERMFHIYHNKLISLKEYEEKLKNATNHLEVIDIASFGDYKQN